jgi:hypothetical protein
MGLHLEALESSAGQRGLADLESTPYLMASAPNELNRGRGHRLEL